MTPDQLQAKHDQDKAEYFEQARQGFVCNVKDWPILTEKLYHELDWDYMIKTVALNFPNKEAIGIAMIEHMDEAWDTVWSEMGMDE